MSSVSRLRKFSQQATDPTGQNLYWGRIDQDGVPFRGREAPAFREEEFEHNTAKVADARVGVFHLAKEDEREAYRVLLEKVANNWYGLGHLERAKDPDPAQPYPIIYVEWYEFYNEQLKK